MLEGKNIKVTKKDLEMRERRVNELLNNVKVRVEYRYGYTAIDLTDENGKVKDTLISGLTKSQAYDILASIEKILVLEKR